MKTTTKQRVARMQGIAQVAQLKRENAALHGAVLNEQIARTQTEAKCDSWRTRFHDMETRFRTEEASCRQLVRACRISENCDIDKLPMINIGTAIDRFDLLNRYDVERIWADILRQLSEKWIEEVTPRICKAIAERVFSPSYHMVERKQAWTREMMESLWKKFPGAHLLAPNDFYAIWDACMDAIKTDKPDKF